MNVLVKFALAGAAAAVVGRRWARLGDAVNQLTGEADAMRREALRLNSLGAQLAEALDLEADLIDELGEERPLEQVAYYLGTIDVRALAERVEDVLRADPAFASYTASQLVRLAANRAVSQIIGGAQTVLDVGDAVA